MSETNNELLAALESADQIKVGDVVTGEVLAVDNLSLIHISEPTRP